MFAGPGTGIENRPDAGVVQTRRSGPDRLNFIGKLEGETQISQ